MWLSHDRIAWRTLRKGAWGAVMRRWLAALACITAMLLAGPTGAAPSYMSYFGLGRSISEAQDHVNLYWSVSWDWDNAEILSQLADAKARGMRAIVHTEFAFFTGSGTFANACPYTPRGDAAARWDAFAQALSTQGLLDTVAAFYPVDEPDLCGVSSSNVLTVLNVIRAHPLTSAKPVAVIFTCDIARKYGGPYQASGGHEYGDAVRAYDWVGVDCYGVGNMFADPAWTTIEFDPNCFCFRQVSGPSYYDNLKAQLNLASQRVILVPQGFIAADSNGQPDNPSLFGSHAAADPAVILMAPFTWFDQTYYPGVRSQPALAQQWRDIGKSIALGNPPSANPPLPAAIPPRLMVSASDVQHFSVLDLDCNTSSDDVCEARLFWQAVNPNPGTQLFMHQGTSAPALVACAPATSFVDIPWISVDIDFTFDLYQMAGCPTTIPPGATPIASVELMLTPMAATGSSNADLASLVLSNGVLSPAFAAGTLNYTAGVASIGNTITVTPTVADATATVTVNGVIVASGSASAPITLGVGSNPIDVVVTAQDGLTTKTYHVEVSYRLPSSCTYALSPPDLSNLPAAGASPTITVTTPAGCPVSVTSFQPWVTITSITPNGGTTAVLLQIGANAGAARATGIVVVDRLFLVTQLGS